MILERRPDDHNVYAVDPASCQVTWRGANYAEQNTGPAAGNGLVYFGSDDHTRRRCPPRTATAPRGTLPAMSPPAAAVTGEAAFASADGNVYAVRATRPA